MLAQGNSDRLSETCLLRYALAETTGGGGRFRGGHGLIRELELTCGRATAIVATSRSERGPWGLAGGEPGAPAMLRHCRDDKERRLDSMCQVELAGGDRLVIQTAGGGGHGPVSLRAPAAIAHDKAEGLSPAREDPA